MQTHYIRTYMYTLERAYTVILIHKPGGTALKVAEGVTYTARLRSGSPSGFACIAPSNQLTYNV